MRKNQQQNHSNKNTQHYAMIGGSFVVLVMVAVGAYFVGVNKGNNDDLTLFPSLNPARAIISQKDLIVNVQPLRDKLNEIGAKDKNISIYFEFLNTGANVTVNNDARFWPASLLKLPVSMAVARKVERGDWSWKNELVLMASDKNDRFGTLYKESIGSRFSIEELVRRTLSDSDNTSNFILVRNLEPEEFQDIYTHLGFKDFLSEEGEIGAKQYSVMFRALFNASYLSEESSQKLLSFMEETPFNNYIASGLPKGVRFSHKIGVSDEKNVFLDSGIVYDRNRPYIITVMIATKDKEYAESQMQEVSSTVYNYVMNYADEAL